MNVIFHQNKQQVDEDKLFFRHVLEKDKISHLGIRYSGFGFISRLRLQRQSKVEVKLVMVDFCTF